MADLADNMTTELPAIPDRLSGPIDSAALAYRAATRAEYLDQVDLVGVPSRSDTAEAFVDLHAATVEDLLTKLIVTAHEICPGYDSSRPDALLVGDWDFPTATSYRLMLSAIQDAALLAGAADAELRQLGRGFRALLTELHRRPKIDAAHDLFKLLEPVEQRICDVPARTPAGAVEKLLVALCHCASPPWVERAIANQRFHELVERKQELDFDQRLIVEALIALGLPGRAAASKPAEHEWAALMSAAQAAVNSTRSATRDDALDHAAEAELAALAKVAAVPAANPTMLAEKIAVLGDSEGQEFAIDQAVPSIIADARRLLGNQG